MTALETELVLEAPDTIRNGERTYRSGSTVYRALECVMKAEGAASVKAVAVAVWGERIGAEVSNATVRSMLRRVNEVLAGIGARERMTLDGEAVLLV